METKEQQVKKAESLLNGRTEKIAQLTKDAENLMALVNKINSKRTLDKDVVINGSKCKIAYLPENTKVITLIFADENEGKSFIEKC